MSQIMKKKRKDHNMYSIRFKIKVKFGHKLHYEIKVMFGEISLKLHQTNWNVARINVSIVVDELTSQMIVYTWLTIDIWNQQNRRTSTGFYALWCHPKWRASNEIGVKNFQLYYGHPYLTGKRLVRAMQRT